MLAQVLRREETEREFRPRELVKTLWTLNIGDYAPKVRAITYPFLRRYAEKIGADFREITQRRFPEWPVTYEKLQIHELGRESDWNIYIDADTLVHPDFFDLTEHLPMDTVCQNGKDSAAWRWRYDDYFRRDGRGIGACNWFTVASRWCLDLWRPLEIDPVTVMARIYPQANERLSGIAARHLIDDFALSRNIARYGLKFTTVPDVGKAIGIPFGFLYHQYLMGEDEKVAALGKMLHSWRLD